MVQPDGAMFEFPGKLNNIAGSNQLMPSTGGVPPQGNIQLGPNFLPGRESNYGSNRPSFNLSDGQPAGSDMQKKVKRGPQSYPSDYYYLLDRWLQLYQDPSIMVSLKRTHAILSKNKIYAKLNISIENLRNSTINQVSLKIKNSPPSKPFLTQT